MVPVKSLAVEVNWVMPLPATVTPPVPVIRAKFTDCAKAPVVRTTGRFSVSVPVNEATLEPDSSEPIVTVLAPGAALATTVISRLTVAELVPPTWNMVECAPTLSPTRMGAVELPSGQAMPGATFESTRSVPSRMIVSPV
jgi:hypothetical protein